MLSANLLQPHLSGVSIEMCPKGMTKSQVTNLDIMVPSLILQIHLTCQIIKRRQSRLLWSMVQKGRQSNLLSRKNLPNNVSSISFSLISPFTYNFLNLNTNESLFTHIIDDGKPFHRLLPMLCNMTQNHSISTYQHFDIY